VSGDEAGRPEVPGYEIVRELGRGGFATVYEAQQLSVDRRVALKVVATSGLSPDVTRRFRSELRTIGTLSWHPHVVALHDGGITPAGVPFLAMELVAGGSWGDRVDQDGPCPPDTVLAVGLQVADALAAAHDAGIVHRDVKPENVLVGRRGEALLADFGVATLTDGTGSVSGSFVGTLLYAAPELLEGTRADPGSDIYAVGATLYTLARGRAAHASEEDDESPAAVIHRVLSAQPPPLPPDVPRPLASVIERAMAREPEGRPASAEELQAELREAAAALAGGAAAEAPEGGAPATIAYRPGLPAPGPVAPPPVVEPTEPPGSVEDATPAPPAPPAPPAAATPAPPPPPTFPPPPTGPVLSSAQESERLASLPPPPGAVDPAPPRPTEPDPYGAPFAHRQTTHDRTFPVPVPVPVHRPAPVPVPAYGGPVPWHDGPRPEVRSSMWRSLLAATFCCAPIGLGYAIQAHLRLIRVGGGLRRPRPKGRLAVAVAYAWSAAMLVVPLIFLLSSLFELRDTTSRYRGRWEGTGAGVTLTVALEPTASGLAMEGTFTSRSTGLECSGRYHNSDFDDADVTFDVAGRCNPPIDLPATVQMSLSEDGETLTVHTPGTITRLRKQS